MDPIVLAVLAVVGIFIAWKLVSGIFKLFAIGAVIVMALIIYQGMGG